MPVPVGIHHVTGYINPRILNRTMSLVTLVDDTVRTMSLVMLVDDAVRTMSLVISVTDTNHDLVIGYVSS